MPSTTTHDEGRYTMVKRYGLGTMVGVLATVAIWSTTFAGLVVALKHFSPGHLLFLRWTLTALLFVGYGVATRMRLPERRDVGRFVLAGLLGFGVYQLLLVNGQQGVSASMAGFLINMNPVFATLIAVALGRDTANGFTWSGLAICMAGLAVMGSAGGGLSGLSWSAGVIVFAALSFALYTIVSKPLLGRYSPLEVTTYAVVAGSLPFLVFAPGSINAVTTASAAQIGTVVFLAVFPGGIAYLLWSRSVAALPPGVASRFLYLVPVVGLFVAWVWVGEAPQMLMWAGGLVTTLGVMLSTMRRMPAWLRRPTPRSAPAAAPTVSAELAGVLVD